MEDHLEGRGVRFAYHRPFTARGALPRVESVADGLVLLGGGPWGSAGSRDVPTLEVEVELARACIARGVPVIGIGLGAQVLALAAGGGTRSAPLEFSVGEAQRACHDALNGYLPLRFPLAIYMRDWPLAPREARVLACDAAGRAVLWQVGRARFGFAGHPGFKVAMVEDLLMEFEETPDDPAKALVALKDAQRGLEDALVPIMTGLVQLTGWMDAPGGAGA